MNVRIAGNTTGTKIDGCIVSGCFLYGILEHQGISAIGAQNERVFRYLDGILNNDTCCICYRNFLAEQ